MLIFLRSARALLEQGVDLGFGLVLGGTAVWLAVETQSLLIGESAGKCDRAAIVAALNETE